MTDSESDDRCLLVSTARIMPPDLGFVNAVAAGLRRRCGLTRDQTQRRRPPRLVVATSGGADSVALLRAIAWLSRRRGWAMRPMVGHIQHHLRDEAEGDAQFVADLARELELPFERRDLAIADRPGNRQAVARRERYAALGAIARSWDAQYVVTAHHGDDQLETMLMRLMRGSSVRGLAAMRWSRRWSWPTRASQQLADRSGHGVGEGSRRPDGRGLARGAGLWLIRPMLGVGHAAAVGYLKQLGQPWREDPTNADLSRLRSRLRHEVLPVLKALRPDVTPTAVRVADHLADVSRVLDRAVDDAGRTFGLELDTVGSGDAASAVGTARGGRAVELGEGNGEGEGDGFPGCVAASGRMISRRLASRLAKPVLTGVLRGWLIQAGVAADRLSCRALEPITSAIRDRDGRRRSFGLANGVAVVVSRQAVVVESDVWLRGDAD